METTDIKPFDIIQTPIDPGLTLLEAGAGTGKTYSLVRIVARQIVEQHISIDKILIVTFTKAATAEISERLQQLLESYKKQLESYRGEQKDGSNSIKAVNTKEQAEHYDLPQHWHNNIFQLEKTAEKQRQLLERYIRRITLALANFDNASIFTIDGFFQRLLKENTLETEHPFNGELTDNEAGLIQTAIYDYWRSYVYPLDGESYATFQKKVTMSDIEEFITLTLNNKAAILDPAYFGESAEIKAAWRTLRRTLTQRKEELKNFMQQPPIGVSKSKETVFQKEKALFYCKQLDELNDQQEHFEDYLTLCEKLSYSTFMNKKSWKATKLAERDNFPNHPIASLLKQIEQEAAPLPKEGYIAEMYGKIYQFVNQRLRKLKYESNLFTYGDVTEKIHETLTKKTENPLRERVRETYEAALIDEFQDTSPHQCQIFLELFNNKKNENSHYLHIIGDPKQSIYKFRGADVYAYLAASQQPGITTYNLLTNHRSSAGMITAVNTVFSYAADPFLTQQKIQFTPAEIPKKQQIGDNLYPPLEVHLFSTEDKTGIADHMANQILDLLDKPWNTVKKGKENTIKASDIAILVLKRKEAILVQKQLNVYNIPSTLQSSNSLFESREAKEMHLLLSAILNPKRHALLKSALLTPAMGLGKNLDENSSGYPIKNEEQIVQCFTQAQKTWQQKRLLPMMQQLIEHIPIKTNLLSCTEGERRLTNFFHLAELLDKLSRKKNLSPTGLLQWLEDAIQGQLHDIESEATEQRISTDANAVQITTLHKSKGLQYEIVFLPFMNKSLSKIPLSYHDQESLKAKIAAPPLNNTEHQEIRLQEEAADGIRLFYVGLTRAKELCHIYHYPFGSRTKSKIKGTIELTLDIETADEIYDLQSKSSQTIKITDHRAMQMHSSKRSYKTDKLIEKKEQLVICTTKGLKIKQNQRTTSFTGITYKLEAENEEELTTDVDGVQQGSKKVQASASIDENSHSSSFEPASFWQQLRPGIALGHTFHELLERVPYTLNPSEKIKKSNREILKHTLAKHQPYLKPPENPEQEEQLQAEIEHFLEEVLYPHQLSEGIRLCDISAQKRLTEAPFLLKMPQFHPHSFAEIIQTNPPPFLPQNYPEHIKKIKTYTLRGYLDGIIDLIFEHKGRYHLLDWKTTQTTGNNPVYLAKSMAQEHYYLQYHLYLLALDQRLQHTLPNYEPEQHLGNIYYVFLRGIDPAIPESGVYMERPHLNRLKKLRQFL